MPIHRKALPADTALRVQTALPKSPALAPSSSENRSYDLPKSASSSLGFNERFLVERARNLDIGPPPPEYVEFETPRTPYHAFSQPRSHHSSAGADIPFTSNLVDSPLEIPGSATWEPKANVELPHDVGAFDQNGPLTQTSFPDQDTATPSKSDKKAKVASALQDASYFLGGLIKHPTESTKHFTILRHSHGIVYYKGPTTSIAITVFADQPLPPNRRYWFQMRGWTGNTGMRAKALLRTNSSWINVTPAKRAVAEELPPQDERAWQRDIKKFQEKKPRNLKHHMVKETAILRVPAEATDGYFRVVLTGADDRATLCPSPVFRVASTSMSASSIKGASLTTLPLELSINILQFAANTMATNAIAPFASSAKDQVTSMLPLAVANNGQTVYSLTGAQDKLDDLNQEYDDRLDLLLEQSREVGTQYVPMQREDVFGEESGPESPFPIRLDSKIVPGTGNGLREVGMPTVNLDSVPHDIVSTLHGVYFGWAYVTPKDIATAELHSEWRHAIITITYDDSKASLAAKKCVRAYLLHSFGGELFHHAKIALVIMGYLRQTIPYRNKEAFFTETMRDIEITRLSLEREQWGPTPTLQRIKTARSERSLTERYVDGRMAVQRHIDSMPIHKLGIRTEGSGLRDRGLYGKGGLYVVRG